MGTVTGPACVHVISDLRFPGVITAEENSGIGLLFQSFEGENEADDGTALENVRSQRIFMYLTQTVN